MTFHACGIGDFSAVLWVERTHEGPFLSVTRVAMELG